MTSPTDTLPIRSTECTITTPGHVCVRRDGHRIYDADTPCAESLFRAAAQTRWQDQMLEAQRYAHQFMRNMIDLRELSDRFIPLEALSHDDRMTVIQAATRGSLHGAHADLSFYYRTESTTSRARNTHGYNAGCSGYRTGYALEPCNTDWLCRLDDQASYMAQYAAGRDDRLADDDRARGHPDYAEAF